MKSSLLSLFSVLLLVVVIVVALGVARPRAVDGSVTLTREDLPFDVTASLNGRLALCLADGDSVSVGDVVATVDAIPSLAVVEELDKLANAESIDELPLALADSLGDLTTPYLEFCQSVVSLRTYFRFVAIEDEMRDAAVRNASLRKSETGQKIVVSMEDSLSHLSLAMLREDSLLAASGAISGEDLKTSVRNYWSRLQNSASAHALSAQRTAEVAEAVSDSVSLMNEHHRKVTELNTAVNVARANLKSSIEQWKRSRVMTSQVNGVLEVLPAVASDNYVSEGSTVARVLPRGSRVIGRLIMPSAEMGQVHEGDDVTLKMYAYPERRFGHLKGTLLSISKSYMSDEDGESFLLAVVGLDPDNQEEFRGDFVFVQGMTGLASVTVEEESLFRRFLSYMSK